MISIEEEKNQKRDNFIKYLNYFLEEYTDANNHESKFEKHSRNAANLARVAGESFCRFIILDSDKTNGEKEQRITDTLNKLIDTITRSNAPYIEDERNRNILQDRLKRILNIGNNDSHDTNYPTTKRDLDEVKSNILYLADYILGEQITQQVEEGLFKNDDKVNNSNGIINISSENFQGNVNHGDEATFGNQSFS